MNEEKPNTSPSQPLGEHTRRDAETALLLGGFVFIMAIPVLIGTFFAQQVHAQIVNFIAGMVLLGVGAGIAAWGWLTIRKT